MCRIRRSDLYKRSQSASPTPSELDPELEAQLRARLASIYGPLSVLTSQATPNEYKESAEINGEDGASEGQAEQEFEFRLFSTAPGTSGNEGGGAAQTILLVNEDQDVGDGAFVVRERNRGYYFAEKAHGEKQLGFNIMALSGEEVLSRAKRRAWGLEVPWRVSVLKVVEKKGTREAVELVGIDGEGDLKRKRPGKKRRILLRERKKSREKLQEQKKAEKEKKEEAEREKRTRRNREKKVKRKMKEKAKKAGGGVEDAVDQDGESLNLSSTV